MEDPELPATEEQTPAAVEHDEQRSLHRRLQPKDSERHLVAERPKSECWYISVDEATFNLHLRAMFTVILTFALIILLMTEHYVDLYFPSYGYYSLWRLYEQLQIKQTGIIFVAKLAAVLTAGVFMKKTRTTKRSSRPLVLHV